ncbi:metal ABC transporter substrate-binding protein [Methylobacterium gossipiicola]|uniref:Zinc/manganese transport system substrate-binding protein n=1 Tax=Methylobacterium gossipiicola TaxID=582675 RepID=A0A1I2UKL3_9HYPH|nr:metal ABC transporter substrate-binding protein [Methylobacterium gossipiicola]SFG75281.1 zinc/manganese transport system substrate-binding protein [Methylobacterium gossipiicola]
MPRWRFSTAWPLAFALLLALLGSAARADAEKLRVVATFSILGDLASQVGGDRVAVTTLVKPDADAHGYAPAPSDAKTLAAADLVVVNGLGLEGWIDRLIKASGTKAPVVVASKGIKPIEEPEESGHGHGHGHDHHADPHAWQSIANAKVYVANIRDGLVKRDPAHAAVYEARAKAYLGELDALEGEVRATIANIPPARRRIITTHDAFGYFTAAYGLTFIAPQGVSMDSEASPRDVARIVRQIKAEKIPAVFLETIADPRLMEQIARESGATVGGKVYSDALSGPDGPAPTYVGMMRHNLAAFAKALGQP